MEIKLYFKGGIIMNNLINVKISDIDEFSNHPFKVVKNNDFYTLVDSINQNGLLNPLVVRRKQNNRYELLSGHRRLLALIELGIKNVDVIVKNMDDDEATIYMVDSNMYREKLLPSEKAFAYKMKLEAIKHQGKKTLRHKMCQSYILWI